MSKKYAAWVKKQNGTAIKITFTSGLPAVKETDTGRILTAGSWGESDEWLALEPSDEVIAVYPGSTFKPDGIILGEVNMSIRRAT